MKKITKSLIAILLTAAMLLSMACISVGALTAADMSDYSEEHWAAEALTWAVDNGLIKGYHDGTIRADEYLTRAEMATVINRLFGASILADIKKFKDVNTGDWFYEEIAKAVNMGTFEGSDEIHMRPDDNIVREEAFVVIARALVLEGADISALEKFGDFGNVSSWADNLLAELAIREYVNGSPVKDSEKNNIYPRECITRAEFAQLLYNIFDNIMDDATIKNAKIEGNLLVNCASDLTMKDVTIDGDLIIADSVGFKSINLTNVKITGRIVIRGGKNIKVTNVTADGGVVVRNSNTTVNFDNYKSEDLFKGFIAKTPATFKKQTEGGYISVGSPDDDDVTYRTSYTVNIHKQNKYGTGYDTTSYKVQDAVVGSRVSVTPETYEHFTFDSAPSKLEDTVKANDATVLDVYYNRNKYTVTFEDGANFMVGVIDTKDVYYEATLDQSEFPEATRNGAKGDFAWSVEREGDTDNYDLKFDNKVANDSWVISTDVTTEFTSETPVTGNITVWPKWGEIIAGVYVQSADLRQPLAGVYYNSNTRAIDTVKDFISLKRNAVLSAIDNKNLDDKLIGKADFILDENRNIKLIEHEVCIVETLKPENVKNEIHEMLESDGITPDDEVVEEVVNELLEDKKVTVTYENVSVIEQYGKKVEEITYEDVKDKIPDSYREVMTEEDIQEAFEDAKKQYSDAVYLTLIQFHDEHPETEAPDWLQEWYERYIDEGGEPVAFTYATGTHTVESIVVVKVNVISGVVIPKYNQAFQKLESKFKDKYDGNQYFERLLQIINPDYLIDGSKDLQNNDAMLSGYTLKSNIDYYDAIYEAVVMADKAGEWFKANNDDEKLEELADEFANLATDYMTTVNELLDKYVEKAVDKLYDLTDKEKIEIIEKYKNRRLSQDDINKVKDILKQAISGYNVTTEDAYEKAYNFDNDKLNGVKFDQTNIPEGLEDSGIVDGFYKELKGNEAWLGRGEYVSGK